MSFDPTNVQAIGVGVTAFLALLVATFVIISGKDNKAGKALIILLLPVVWWAWFGFFYHIFDYIPAARIVRALSVLGIVGISVGFIRFASVYLEEKRPFNKIEETILIFLQTIGLVLAFFIFADIFFGKGFVVGPLEFSPKQALAPEAGPLLAILIAHFAACILFGGYFLARRVQIETEARGKREAAIILFSTTMGLILGGSRFAPWYGVDFAPILGGLGVPLFTVGIFYIMAAYKTFNIRLVAAEFLIFFIWTIMFFRTLIHPTLKAAALDVVILFATIVAGIFLIRSVLREVKSRVEVERISKEIAGLNKDLEHRVAERTMALERASEHIKAIVEHLPVGLIEISDKKILRRANKTATDILGFDRQAKLNTEISPDDIMLWAVVEGAERVEGDQQVAEFSIEGSLRRDFEIITSLLMTEQGEKGSVILIRDITHEKEFIRAKNEFLTISAHKLRTPITALYWALSTLSEEKIGTLTKKQKEIVKETNERTEAIIDLIDRFLLAAEMASGKFAVRRRSGNVGILLDGIISQIRSYYDSKKIKCVASINKNIPDTEIDVDKISLVFKNILSNAFIYTSPRGRVDVSAELKKSKIIIQIRDTGIGIPENDTDKLFQKFWRGVEAARMYTEGSGLGLFIAKNIIEAHDGSIFIVSKEGKGTTVTIELPG